jgi:hypothetical protein
MSRKILIISTHYPPSNLAGVHRSRLFAEHLPSFGWEPVILTIHEQYYEEDLDWKLFQLLPAGQRIEKVAAYPLTRPRLIGDLGLRGFLQLRKKALDLIRREKIDFVYIPIPSFYVSLIGPYLHRKTGVPYGIDYIDPWVHRFPGSDKRFSRHWWSTRLARLLEPIAVKRAALITGVAEGYYQGVLERNPRLKAQCTVGAMPYGGEKGDHEKLLAMNTRPYLFKKKPGVLQMVYAGTLLPKSYKPLELMMQGMQHKRLLYKKIEFHFIGTGKPQTSKTGFTVKPLAEKYGLWESVIFEHPARIPYLDVLVHLEASSGVLILGSTEPHYTPSKVYQAVLSKKPILAVLHPDSSAFALLDKAGLGVNVSICENSLADLGERFNAAVERYHPFAEANLVTKSEAALFEKYSAKTVAFQLSQLLNTAAGK